jgi:hypothetical protein
MTWSTLLTEDVAMFIAVELPASLALTNRGSLADVAIHLRPSAVAVA